jgi:hypothetical protein
MVTPFVAKNVRLEILRDGKWQECELSYNERNVCRLQIARKYFGGQRAWRLVRKSDDIVIAQVCVNGDNPQHTLAQPEAVADAAPLPKLNENQTRALKHLWDNGGEVKSTKYYHLHATIESLLARGLIVRRQARQWPIKIYHLTPAGIALCEQLFAPDPEPEPEAQPGAPVEAAPAAFAKVYLKALPEPITEYFAEDPTDHYSKPINIVTGRQHSLMISYDPAWQLIWSDWTGGICIHRLSNTSIPEPNPQPDPTPPAVQAPTHTIAPRLSPAPVITNRTPARKRPASRRTKRTGARKQRNMQQRNVPQRPIRAPLPQRRPQMTELVITERHVGYRTPAGPATALVTLHAWQHVQPVSRVSEIVAGLLVTGASLINHSLEEKFHNASS